MPRRTKKTEDEKTIPEMAEDVARVEMSLMYKDGKLTAYGRSMEKILDRALPPGEEHPAGNVAKQSASAAARSGAAAACTFRQMGRVVFPVVLMARHYTRNPPP